MVRTLLFISVLVVALVASTGVAVAQEIQQNDVGCLDPNVRAPRTISFGVLNSRGINIPKPLYPAAARSAGLSGQVMAIVVIDETPAAYKPIEAIMAAQSDLVEIVHTLHQVVCVKG
jgi:hypothetical protein